MGWLGGFGRVINLNHATMFVEYSAGTALGVDMSPVLLFSLLSDIILVSDR